MMPETQEPQDQLTMTLRFLIEGVEHGDPIAEVKLRQWIATTATGCDNDMLLGVARIILLARTELLKLALSGHQPTATAELAKRAMAATQQPNKIPEDLANAYRLPEPANPIGQCHVIKKETSIMAWGMRGAGFSALIVVIFILMLLLLC